MTMAIGSPSLRYRVGRLKWLLTSLSWREFLTATRIQAESASRRRARLERLRATPVGNIVFVCYGNIMRSAYATAVVKRERPSLARRVCGAGTHARAGKAAEPAAREVARERGADLDSHAATPLASASVGRADLVICMDFANAARAARTPGISPSQVFLIGDFSEGNREVPDPYGNGVEAAREAFVRIEKCCSDWLAFLDCDSVDLMR